MLDTLFMADLLIVNTLPLSVRIALGILMLDITFIKASITHSWSAFGMGIAYGYLLAIHIAVSNSNFPWLI